MSNIRCNHCDELNDSDAVKCETCKASLSTPATYCSEEDECERDFRFIEEAEFIGEVYKLENVEDLEHNYIKTETIFDGTICCQIPDSNVESIVKLEDDVDSENVSFEIVTVEQSTVDIENEKHYDDAMAFDVKHKSEMFQVKIKKTIVCSGDNNGTTNKKLKAKEEISPTTTPAVPYNCTECPKSFKRKASLKAHINRIHNLDDSSACCAGHVSSNTSKSNGCSSPSFIESCDESEYLYSGEETEKPSTDMKPLNTPRKGKRKLKHEESDSENSDSRKNTLQNCKTELSPCSKSKQNKPNGIVYKCAACEKITDSYQEHLKHIVIHEKVDDSLTVPTSLEQLKKTPSGFLECKKCDGVFMSAREYKIHQRSHEGVHQCDICKTILLTSSSLRKHKKRMHRHKECKKETLFECNICNEKYESQLLMLQHRKKHTEVMKKIEEMTIIHRSGGKTSYVCKICTKTSNNKFRHEEHLRIHTKEKPYKCEECGIAIATSNAMAHHRRIHENITFDCHVCDATYRHKKSLKKHLKLHTGERPFVCRHCDKTFAFNYTRADHERKCHIDGGTSRIQKRKRKGNSEKKSTKGGDNEINETAQNGNKHTEKDTGEENQSKYLEKVL